MQKQNIELYPTKLPEEKIYSAYCDNYDSIHYLFIEFQFSWLQQAYQALKDLDKYNILVYLYKENFIGLSEIFKVKSLNQFYINKLKFKYKYLIIKCIFYTLYIL